MTIRVPFWVNDVKIAEVEISRTFSDIKPGVHRYVWYLRTWTNDGRPCMTSSIVDHRYSDGALALTRAVLERCKHIKLHAPKSESGRQQ